jgi:hypothetical protein
MKAIEAEIRGNPTLRTRCRAEALPKVRTLFEDAHAVREVRILENPGDSFEGAHPFARCAPKTEHLRKEKGLPVSHSAPRRAGDES